MHQDHTRDLSEGGGLEDPSQNFLIIQSQIVLVIMTQKTEIIPLLRFPVFDHFKLVDDSEAKHTSLSVVFSQLRDVPTVQLRVLSVAGVAAYYGLDTSS